MNEAAPPAADGNDNTPPVPMTNIQRRIMGVLIEKARTTPDSYPLSLNGLVTGANQKSNRFPLMQLTPEQIEETLEEMRALGAVAEVHGGGRVPKFRHYAGDYLGVQGAQAGIIAELLLRGAQTAGDLRSRASRFGTIADLATLNELLNVLIERKLVVSLTSGGRGQLFTHNLYEPDELERVKSHAASEVAAQPKASSSGTSRSSAREETEELKQEVKSLRSLVEDLAGRVAKLEG